MGFRTLNLPLLQLLTILLPTAPGRIQKVDPLMGVPIKYTLSSIGPQIRGSTYFLDPPGGLGSDKPRIGNTEQSTGGVATAIGAWADSWFTMTLNWRHSSGLLNPQNRHFNPVAPQLHRAGLR